MAGLLLAALVQGVQEVSRFALASPIYFEEDFRGCGDGVSITTLGWTHEAVGAGTFACDNSEHFPDEVDFNGTESFQHRLVTSTIDRWGSPVFSISGASTLSLGLAVRFEAFPASTFGGAFQFTFRDGGVVAGGIGVPGSGGDAGDIHTVNNVGTWENTFFQLVLDTWYLIEFDINRGTDRYGLLVNGTVIDANGPLGGTTQSMAPPGGPHDIDSVAISDRSSGQAWIDWIFTDQLTLDFIADTEIRTSSTVSISATPDASTDVIWDLSVAPSFLSISALTGLITGTPTDAGVFSVTVTGNVSTGQASRSFILTVVAVGLASFGYSGITEDDPCGATYFNTATGRVRPVPCSDVLLSLDMETIDGATGELHDFALDATGTLNHTATRNAVNSVEATFGIGQAFNGSGPQNLTLNGVVSELGRPESWTAHWWLLLNDDSDNRTLWAKWADVDGSGGWYFEVTGADQMLVSWGGTDNHTFAFILPKGGVFPLTVTFDFETGSLTLYSNRTLRESAIFLAHGASEAAGVIPEIGQAANTTFNMNGTLDEFILWQRRALTLDQVVGLQTPFPSPIPLVPALPPATTVSTLDALLPGILVVASIIGVIALLGFVTWKMATSGLERMKEIASKVKKR